MSLESSQGNTLTPRKSRATNRMRRLITVMASVSMLVMALVIFPESSVKPDVAEAACYGSTYVSGYVKSNGTYVSGHYRTCPGCPVSSRSGLVLYVIHSRLAVSCGRCGRKITERTC